MRVKRVIRLYEFEDGSWDARQEILDSLNLARITNHAQVLDLDSVYEFVNERLYPKTTNEHLG